MSTEELLKILRDESDSCTKSATMNGSPNGEAFQIAGIVLCSLANRIESRETALRAIAGLEADPPKPWAGSSPTDPNQPGVIKATKI